MTLACAASHIILLILAASGSSSSEVSEAGAAIVLFPSEKCARLDADFSRNLFYVAVNFYTVFISSTYVAECMGPE